MSAANSEQQPNTTSIVDLETVVNEKTSSKKNVAPFSISRPTNPNALNHGQSMLSLSFRGLFNADVVSEEEKARNLEILRDLRARGALKGTPMLIDEIAAGHPELAALLSQYDANNDGHIDVDEVIRVLTDLKQRKSDVDLLKKIILGGLLFLVILLISNSLLTVWMIQLTRNIYVDDDNVALVNANDEMLKTDKPRFYTSLSELTLLPPAALNAITRMSFTTTDGGVYNLLVEGKLPLFLNCTLYLPIIAGD
jgi:hypothetical protein